MSDALTFAVKKAAMLLDNDFYAYSDYAVGIPVTAPIYLKTALLDGDLAYVCAHPEEFAIIDIAAK